MIAGLLRGTMFKTLPKAQQPWPAKIATSHKQGYSDGNHSKALGKVWNSCFRGFLSDQVIFNSFFSTNIDIRNNMKRFLVGIFNNQSCTNQVPTMGQETSVKLFMIGLERETQNKKMDVGNGFMSIFVTIFRLFGFVEYAKMKHTIIKTYLDDDE